MPDGHLRRGERRGPSLTDSHSNLAHESREFHPAMSSRNIGLDPQGYGGGAGTWVASERTTRTMDSTACGPGRSGVGRRPPSLELEERVEPRRACHRINLVSGSYTT